MQLIFGSLSSAISDNISNNSDNSSSSSRNIMDELEESC